MRLEKDQIWHDLNMVVVNDWWTPNPLGKSFLLSKSRRWFLITTLVECEMIFQETHGVKSQSLRRWFIPPRPTWYVFLWHSPSVCCTRLWAAIGCELLVITHCRSWLAVKKHINWTRANFYGETSCLITFHEIWKSEIVAALFSSFVSGFANIARSSQTTLGRQKKLGYSCWMYSRSPRSASQPVSL